jgi:predicted SnoaL-like aldol condensation-catalyzing enzyme
MSTEQNKAVVRRFIEEVLLNQNVAIADELMAPDYVNHLAPGGREGFKQFNTMMHSAFPDLKYDAEIEHLIAEGDYVVVRATYHYTNAGKEATESELSEYRLVNGKIVEDWPPSGNLALLQRIGVTLPSG